MTEKFLHEIKQARLIIATKYQGEALDFAYQVLDQLEQGLRDIPIHPPIANKGKGNYISANELLNNPIYGHQRKICYELGKLLQSAKTTRIYGKCGLYIGCRDPRWQTDGFCACDYGRSKLNVPYFWKYHIDNDYEDIESFSLLPWTCKVGVRFVIPGERQNHQLSKYCKTLGPFPRDF